MICLVLGVGLLAASPGQAITGGDPAPPDIADRSAMIVSTRGAACSSAVLAPDLLLTAAHCVAPASDYAVVVFEAAGPRLIPASRIALHPRYSAEAFALRRPTPDLALVKLAEDLPASFRKVRLAPGIHRSRPGESFLLAGFGMTDDGNLKSAGRLFAVELPAIGNTIDASGIIMIRLSAGGERMAGACDGDSGGPVYREGTVAAIIGWRKLGVGRHCGSVTGATLVAPQIDWIADTALGLGSRLAD